MSSDIILSLVVPCYNEEKNIPIVFDRAAQLTLENSFLEVIIVNNGSTDGSGLVLEKLLNQNEVHNQIRVTTVPKNLGYGFGIVSGLKEAKGSVLSFTHADLQTDLADVIKAFKIYKQQETNSSFLLVKGKRIGRGLLERFFSGGMAWYASIKLGVHLAEVNAQPKVFSAQFFKQHIESDAPKDFSLDLFILYKAQTLGKVFSFDVDFGKRLHGEAKGGGSWKTRIKLIKRTFAYISTLAQQLKAKS